MVDAMRWLTPPFIASQLGIKPSKVVTWIERGELKGVNVANRQGRGCRPRWRVSPEALAEFLANRCSARKPAPEHRVKSRSPKLEPVIEFFR